MEFLQNFVPTSKAQLIQVAMYMNKGDVAKAQEFVDFYAKNLDLPDFDPVAPTLLQQVKSGASGLFGWVKENKEDLVQGWQFVHDIIKNKGEIPVMPSQGTEEVIPPINE